MSTSGSGLCAPSLEQLKPFPLPEKVKVLPKRILDEFSQLYQLVVGYMKSLDQYKTYRDKMIVEINNQIDKINRCVELLENYNSISLQIDEQVKELKDSFEEWTNLETIQYQLLASNFNLATLKSNFKKLIAEGNIEIENHIRAYKQSSQSEQDLNNLLDKFRDERKTYHLRKEKLNRWDEERVGGFI